MKPSKLQELARKYREAQRWWLKCNQARREATKYEGCYTPETDAGRRYYEADSLIREARGPPGHSPERAAELHHHRQH